jgi:hypothetical protein
VALVNVALVGVPRIGVTKVGEVANTAEPVPVSSVKAPKRLAELNEPSDAALPTEVTAPVKLAFVVTLPAVRPDAVPVMFVPTNALGVPNAGVTNVGLVDNTTLPDPVEVVTPVPPCKTVKAVVRPVIEVMSEFAPLAAALKLVLALAAVEAPVPPSATAKSVMPVIVPPVMVALLDVSGPVTPAVAVTAPVSVDAPVTFKVVLAVIALAARVVLATVAVPVAAPMFTAVAAPNKFTVVAVVLTRANVVDGVVMPVVTAGEVKFVVPVAVSVPATAKVLPAPTLRPTLVPVPAAVNSASTKSRSALTLPPQEFELAPTSGLVSNRFVVVVSAIFSP